MLRLVLKKKDNSKSLTLTTDGFDGLMNIFITENPKGDVYDFEKLGLQLGCGETINVGKLKEFALKNSMILVSYPEGFNEQSVVLQDIVEYDYVFEVEPTSLSFVGGGEQKSYTITSTKQKKVGGKPEGEPISVKFTNKVTGTGFSINENDNKIIAAANQTESTRSGKVVFTQEESGKTVEITLSQATGVVTYDYTLTTDPTSLSFTAAGEKKTFTVTSKRQKKINGQNSGNATDHPFSLSIEGEGFSKDDSEKSVTAAVNAGGERTGKVTVTQNDSKKTAEISLTQEAGA